VVDVARLRAAFPIGGRPPVPAPIEAQGALLAAVLAVFYESDGQTWLILTRRSQALRAHRGEVSFPGGSRDDDEALVTTALREAEEEIGLDRAAVEVIGELDHLSTAISSVAIAPFVAVLADPPGELRADAAEVERILHVPVAELLLDDVFHEEVWELGGLTRPIWFFELVGDTVWGATAAMLCQLLVRVLGLDDRRWRRAW